MPPPEPSLWVLIPAKSSRLAKRRLSPLLSPVQRADLCLWFLENTLLQLRASAIAANTLVLTTDPLLETVATRFGIPTLPDPPGAGLNAALENGRAHAIVNGATSLLVLPTDLPYLTPGSLRAFLERARRLDPCVLIAPDREGAGTNALLLRPSDAIPFRFGVNSAALHGAEARKRGIPVIEYRDPTLARDVDLPDHYREFAAAHTQQA